MADRPSTQLLNITYREFGRHLRDERERRGLKLQAIAEATKVPLALLAGLERGDIEDWPGGLFGRAHLRAYAVAVGLSPEPLISEFLRLSGNDAVPAQAPSAIIPDDGLRLTLAADRRWDFRAIGKRAFAVGLDLCGIFTIAAVSTRLLATNFSLTCALVTLTYYALTTMALGQSVTLWWLGGRVVQRTIRSTANTRNLLLMPQRRVSDSPRRLENPEDFRETPAAPVAQAASR